MKRAFLVFFLIAIAVHGDKLPKGYSAFDNTPPLCPYVRLYMPQDNGLTPYSDFKLRGYDVPVECFNKALKCFEADTSSSFEKNIFTTDKLRVGINARDSKCFFETINVGSACSRKCMVNYKKKPETTVDVISFFQIWDGKKKKYVQDPNRKEEFENER
jgi:hypothetical protein